MRYMRNGQQENKKIGWLLKENWTYKRVKGEKTFSVECLIRGQTLVDF